MSEDTGLGWTEPDIGGAGVYVRSYFMGQKAREMADLSRRIGDKPLWFRTFLTPSAGVPFKRVNDIETGIATLREDSVRVARHLAGNGNWTTYLRRVGSVRGGVVQATVKTVAETGPGALYVLLVTDLLWVAWERYDPRMEAGISTVYPKIGIDNQLLWDRGQLGHVLTALSRVKPSSN